MPDARGDGYVDDIPYTHGYHAAMNPRVMQWTLAQAGYRPPEVRSACELGFGQGVSLAIHGSVGAVAWQGTDFNLDHARNARALCEGCEPQPRIYAESFAEYFARSDLPAFDFIALHAVWSWVSPENRARIVEFIRQRLRPGGALYLSYNCLPGWQPMLALREQLVERAAAAQREGLPLAEAIRRAVVELERLEPEHDVILHSLKRRSVSYLAHEFFNRDWHPMHFAQVAAELLPLGLTYLGQADYSDSYDQWRLNDAQQAMLADIEDPLLRETTRDIILDRRFRRDYWVRSEPATAISSPSRLELRLWVPSAIRSADTETPDAVTEWFRSLGAPGAIVHRSIETAVEHAALGYALGRGWVELVREQILADTQRTPVSTINRRILDRVHHDPEMSVLASHLTGSGVELGWWTLALLAAMRAGLSGEGVVDQVMQQSDRLGLVLSRRGFALTPEEMRDELGLRYADLLARSDEWCAAFVI